MIKYLNHALQIVRHSTHINARQHFNWIVGYIRSWEKYKNDRSPSPLYKKYTGEMNLQEFELPTGETVSITWDVGYLNSIAPEKLKKEFKSLDGLNRLLDKNLIGVRGEMDRIKETLQPIHPHQYQPLLIMNFVPFNEHILIDGRHRYFEYQYYNPNVYIPIYVFDDEQCMYAIPYKNELLAYIIIHNVEVLKSIAIAQDRLLIAANPQTRRIFSLPRHLDL